MSNETEEQQQPQQNGNEKEAEVESQNKVRMDKIDQIESTSFQKNQYVWHTGAKTHFLSNIPLFLIV